MELIRRGLCPPPPDSTGMPSPSQPRWPRNPTGPTKSWTSESILLTQAKHSTPLSQELPARGGAIEACRPTTRSMSGYVSADPVDGDPHLMTGDVTEWKRLCMTETGKAELPPPHLLPHMRNQIRWGYQVVG
jgi:hypothetical protein